MKSMTVAGNDISASQYRVNDLNGKPCALVKVQLATRGAKFAGSVIGTPEFKNGVYWVYMPAGVKELEVQHNSFVPCHVTFGDYGIQSLQSLTTYVLTLLMPQGGAAPVDDGMRYLVITVKPANAMVFVDDKAQMVRNGIVSVRLPRGTHSYRVEAPGFASQNGTVELQEGRRSLTIALESALAQVNVSCPTLGAQIYVNDQLQGVTPWSGQLAQGNYLFEARLDGYQPQQESVTLQERERRDVVLQALVPYTGSLDVNYQPMDAEVWIDGRQIGVSPDIFRNISTGSHTVEIRAAGYQTAKHTIQIKKGETLELGGELTTHILSEAETKQMKTELDKAFGWYREKKYSEAFPVFLRLGKAGYQDGTLFGYLGMCYQFGNGTEKDEQQMLYWYEKAYLANAGWACYYYGNVLYKKGDYEKALKCYVKGSTSNWAEESATKAAQMYEKGEGTYANKEKAIEYYRIAAKASRFSTSDAHRALSRLGASVFTEEDIDSTTKWTEESAYQAGVAYEQGNGVEKNLSKAIELYRKSAGFVLGTLDYSDAGRALARLGCGLYPASEFEKVTVSTAGMGAQAMYEKGNEEENRSFKPNYTKAWAYYNAAAKAGSTDAIVRLGEIYTGCAAYPFKDIPKAIRYLQSVMDKSSKACEKLGSIYEYNKDYKDLDMALKYYIKGSTFGDNDACPLHAGLLYDEKANYEEALRYFELSANTPPKNQGWAMYLAGDHYEEGKGCAKNLQKAIEWYRKSAKTNNYYASSAKSALKRLGASE